MTKTEKIKFINEHLYNELRYMLCASASWCIAKKNSKDLPMHFIVYTMDSAFLHARSLFEFFTYVPSGKKTYLVTWKEFELDNELKSEVYKTWRVSLHHHVMHLESRQGVPNVIEGVHLKEMVLQFSIEVVRLWIEFSKKLDDELKKEMDKILEKSVNEAEIILPGLKKLL